jgi:tRNA-splicing endonuclease subunit Sen34
MHGTQMVNKRLTDYKSCHIFNHLSKLWTANVRAFADWQKLREEHRIVGALIGCLAHLPRQDSFLGLPMVLLPEEVTLLLEQKVVRLVSYSLPSYDSSIDMRLKFQEYRKAMYTQQVCNINLDSKSVSVITPNIIF